MLRGRASLRVVAGLAALAVAGLTACSNEAPGGPAPSGSGGGAAANKVIGVSVADQKSLFYVASVQGTQAEADKRGYKLLVTSANNDSNQQVKQVNDLLTQQVGALIFTSQDSTAAAAGVRAANQANVPVIAVDQRPESGQGKLATDIATDSVKAAHDLCTWMFQQMGGAGELAILHGVLGSTAEIQRTVGIDGFPTMFDAVEQGLTQATMAQQPYHMGEIAVDNAISIIEGKGDGIPAEQFQDTVLINKDTVGQNDVTTFYGPNAKSAG